MGQTQLEKYFYETRSPVYAVLFVVPLFLIYEILALTLHKLQITHLRNGADVMMRNLVSLFGLDNFPFIVLLILGALAVTAGYYKKKHQMQIRLPYFGLLMGESMLYALMMGSIALNTTNFILSIPHLFSLSLTMFDSNLWVNVMLSFGAGIHEEFFFRLVLIQAFLFLGSFIFKANPKSPIWNWNSIIALILSSCIFSYFHYIGEYGDTFAWGSFVFRWVSGLYLAVIYLTRGFGVSAWTHAFYDLFLMTGIME
ncbi:MAG: CPBP family intramembrane glutamic endopeptidase [bacterium]|nr:CPBP family intramembrane glutamic endopeptidase [bacterium]